MRVSRRIIGLGGFLIGTAALFAVQRSCDNSYKRDYQQRIELLAPDRYQRLMRETDGKYLGVWRDEFYKMQDSLRVDSIYQEGYKTGYKAGINSKE